jgi:Leucine-rich repeat (LRR) protein
MKSCKTIKETKKPDSNLTLDTISHKYISYNCPFCASLPEILCFNQGVGTVKLKCKKHGENTLEIEDYMEKMSKWESTSELNTKNKCSKHGEAYENFCETCQENICNNCMSEHDKHHVYYIGSLSPDDKEILYIRNLMEVLFQQKMELVKKIKNLENKINFYDTLIYAYKSNSPNYYLNINLKHLIYGENLTVEEIKNTEFAHKEKKEEIYKDFIKNNFIEATKGLNQLNFVNAKKGNQLVDQLFRDIENLAIFPILKTSGKIQGPKEIIELKNVKYMNFRGNNLSSTNFLNGNKFPNLEILSLSENEIISIDNFKKVSFPELKELYLAKNRIENIDVLSEIKAPKLRILWLANNKISSIDVFNKVNFQLLLKLCLSYNNISDISVFSNKKVKFPQLYELYLNDNPFEMKSASKIIEELFLKIKQFYY